MKEEFTKDVSKRHKEDLGLAYSTIVAALLVLMPDEKVEINDGSIEGYNGRVTLDLVGSGENPRDGLKQEIAGWQVHVVRYRYATRNEPEESDLVEVGTPSDWQTAVVLFVDTIFKQKAGSYWLKLSDVAMAQACID